jgi:lipoprotein-anchoring transpeptidase ErfK/SrfK
MKTSIKAGFAGALALVCLNLMTAPVMAQDNRSASSQDEPSLSVSLPDGISASDLGKRDPQMIAIQTMLDRSRHSPGVIDGYGGGNTDRAIASYKRAHGLGGGSTIDRAFLRSLLETQGGDVFSTYTITQDDLNYDFVNVPDGFEAKAGLDRLGYETPLEMLAERFHMDQEFLRALNPGADFGRAGTTINVVSHGDDTLESSVGRIEVRKGEGAVLAFDGDGTLLASYPATIGSAQFPSPDGSMEVAAVAPEANYTFTPEGSDWGPDETVIIAPGPNNPVGGIWIDLTKEGYGIHGSPDPQLIGKTSSHGCVRLTNWDARELADSVNAGVPVVFR